MALHDDISNNAIANAIEKIPGDLFNTLRVVDLLVEQEPVLIDELKQWSPRNWRAVIGKAVKRYAVTTGKLKQVSTQTESPARWRKV